MVAHLGGLVGGRGGERGDELGQARSGGVVRVGGGKPGNDLSGWGPTVLGVDIILISGLWLPASIWRTTMGELEALGHRPVAVALPGVEDRSTSATLDDQLGAVLDAAGAVDAPLIVGHSAAATLAWLVADRGPDSIAGVVMIGGIPASSGSTYASFFPIEGGAMAFPGWAPFDGPDAADLDEDARGRLAAMAVPVPAAVATATVEYRDPRRRTVGVTLICPEFSPADARSWIDAGDAAELAAAEHLDLVDIDSGHWPMVTRPEALSRLLHDAAHAPGTGSR